MHILVVGLSHRTAPVDLRERVDFQGRVETALRTLAARGSTHEAVVLSTCNRAEVYAASRRHRASPRRPRRLHERVPPASIGTTCRRTLYDLADLDSARHLFRVAAGLDSLVVGEPQILGQVKEAHTLATGAHTVGPVLNRLFHSSFAAGKRVRTRNRAWPRAPSRSASRRSRSRARSSATSRAGPSSSSARARWAS